MLRHNDLRTTRRQIVHEFETLSFELARRNGWQRGGRGSGSRTFLLRFGQGDLREELWSVYHGHNCVAMARAFPSIGHLYAVKMSSIAAMHAVHIAVTGRDRHIHRKPHGEYV